VVNSAAVHHLAVSEWWHETLREGEPIGLPWIGIGGFLRLSTRGGILPKPLTIESALSLVDDWLALEQIVIVRETGEHWSVLRGLIAKSGTGGNLIMDAHLAAIAISHRARLASCDSAFKRFDGLRWLSPLDMRPGRAGR
jgi:hypothetical protein